MNLILLIPYLAVTTVDPLYTNTEDLLCTKIEPWKALQINKSIRKRSNSRNDYIDHTAFTCAEWLKPKNEKQKAVFSFSNSMGKHFDKASQKALSQFPKAPKWTVWVSSPFFPALSQKINNGFSMALASNGARVIHQALSYTELGIKNGELTASFPAPYLKALCQKVGEKHKDMAVLFVIHSHRASSNLLSSSCYKGEWQWSF